MVHKYDFGDAGLKMRVKYRGVFDYDRLYQEMHDWFVDQSYEFHEKVFKHRIPYPTGAEQRILWEAWRKVSGYAKFIIRVFFHTKEQKEVTVVREGQKKKLTSARLVVEVWGILEIDYANRWGGSKTMQVLDDWFRNYILKKKITNGLQDELYYNTLKVYTLTKEILDMEAKHNATARRY